MLIVLIAALVVIVWRILHATTPTHFVYTFPHSTYEKIETFYINLDTRTDRRVHVEKQLQTVGINSFVRVAGVPNERGELGCSLAHVKALNLRAKESHHTLIVEDDATFNVSRFVFHRLLWQLQHLSLKWDVIMFCCNAKHYRPTSIPNMVHIEKAFTSACYLVHRDYYPIFKRNVEQGCALLAENESQKSHFCIDTFWFSLQRTGRWFSFTPLVAYQMDGYSDIERRFTRYPDKVSLPNNNLPSDTLRFSLTPTPNAIHVVEHSNVYDYDVVIETLRIQTVNDWFLFAYHYILYHPTIKTVRMDEMQFDSHLCVEWVTRDTSHNLLRDAIKHCLKK